MIMIECQHLVMSGRKVGIDPNRSLKPYLWRKMAIEKTRLFCACSGQYAEFKAAKSIGVKSKWRIKMQHKKVQSYLVGGISPLDYEKTLVK